jgi:prepilin-type N-terminal cleavage/methylation domain-containing protein/prepilin-type processing-associated H-X9-DG protein
MNTPHPPGTVPRRAFTLIELLIVIVIIGVLAGMLVPTLVSAIKTAENLECQSNLQQIAKAVLGYCTDYRGTIPPTKIENSGLYWCNLLAKRYLPAENTTHLAANQMTGQHSVLICPAASPGRVVISGGGGADTTALSSIQWPDEAVGWYRLGKEGSFTTDCTYYWNGFVGDNAESRARFPSLNVDLDTPKEYDFHDVSEIPQRSNMAMVADGIFFQQSSADKPQLIGARHPGTYGERRKTNIAFYDAHVESMDRYPVDDNWREEIIADSETEMVPIMSRDQSKPFEGGPPYFLLPKR